MLTVLGVTFPLFATVALGYGLVAKGVFKSDDMAVFGRFVMNIALPALIFRAVASRPAQEVFNPAYIGPYLVGALATVLVTFLWFSATTDPSRRGVAVMGSSCPNSGFVGYPLVFILYPDIAGVVLAMNVLVESVVVLPLALIIMEMGKPAGEGHPLTRAQRLLVSVVRRPLMIAIVAGLAISLGGWPLPGPIDRVVEILSASAVAVGLIVIGGSLVGLPVRGNRALAAQIVVGKLLVQPLMIVLVLVAAGALGLSLAGDLRSALILTAALPVITIYPVLAQEVGHAGLASLAQLGGTMGAFFTLTLLLLVLP